MADEAQTTGWFWRLYAVVMRRPPEAEDIAWAKREVARIEAEVRR